MCGVDFLQVCACMESEMGVIVCIYVLCRPNGKLYSLSYRAVLNVRQLSLASVNDADCKLFTESHLANNLMPFLLQT